MGIEHLEDDQAREYLTGKMDNLNKLEKTRDNLKKNNNDEVSEITSASIITLEEEIKKLSDELPDNMSLLKKIKKTKYSNILEYVLFQLQRATINFTKKNKIEENNTRNELVSELDEALNDEANGIDNHELIQELQNSLSAIDVEKEKEYLKNKTSWDILEREKPKKQFIKLESLREGYHDPTLLKIHKKVIDADLPAPHEKMVFSHLSQDQKEIAGEIKRTFQKIKKKS